MWGFTPPPPAFSPPRPRSPRPLRSRPPHPRCVRASPRRREGRRRRRVSEGPEGPQGAVRAPLGAREPLGCCTQRIIRGPGGTSPLESPALAGRLRARQGEFGRGTWPCTSAGSRGVGRAEFPAPAGRRGKSHPSEVAPSRSCSAFGADVPGARGRRTPPRAPRAPRAGGGRPWPPRGALGPRGGAPRGAAGRRAGQAPRAPGNAPPPKCMGDTPDFFF